MNQSAKHFWLTAFGLLLLLSCVYGQTVQFDFINYDDDYVVVLNDHVNTGLSWSNVYWALSESDWHPVTWVSHMLDVEIYGLDAGGHHASSVILHALNTILLLYFLRMAGINLLLSSTMAALFALHPMHVESVAWIAERKDVLSCFFMLLTLIAYLHYARRSTIATYTVVLAFAVLGLMSKAMLVTLPFVLLLLDYFPLNRLNLPDAGPINIGALTKRLTFLVVEKIPLFILVTISMVVAYLSQRSGGAMDSGAGLSLFQKLTNAIVSYSHYTTKAIIPGNLSLLYPHPAQWPMLEVLRATTMILTITGFVLWNFRARPYLFVGWFWFLGTLVPVIGLVQIGDQYMADRYSYIPYIGLFLALLPFISELSDKVKRGRAYYLATMILLLAFYTAATMQYVSHWRNSITVFTHALLVTDPSYASFTGIETVDPTREFTVLKGLWTPYNNLGLALAAQGQFKEALRHFEAAIHLAPHLGQAHNHKGIVLAALGRKQEALAAFGAALEVQPEDEIARRNLQRFQQAWNMTSP